jgi:NAD(P)H-dependent FMN reductase
MEKKVKVILGSVRTGRLGKSVADWVMKESKSYTGNLSFELIDLKDINLPFLDEPVPAKMSNDYVQEHTKKWSKTIQEADAIIIVVPEYNSGYTPVIKNAIDFLYTEWNKTPVSLIGYGGGGGTNCLRQLTEVLKSVEMNVLEEKVTISQIWDAIDENGNVKNKNVRGDIFTIFKQLEDACNIMT